MQATIKSKLIFGLSFLFLIILLLSGVGAYFLYQLARSTEVTLHNNYRSVGYAQRMADALADLRDAQPGPGGAGAARVAPTAARARQTFARFLAAEQANITEPGEGPLADSLAAGFQQFGQAAPATAAARGLYQQLRRQVGRVAALNLRAIEEQSQRTRRTATRTITGLGLLAAVGILATFSFIFSFPDYVNKPVDELTAGIRRLAAGDYSQRLPTAPYNEFSDVAQAFNSMARRLESYETADGTPRIDSSGPLDLVTSHRHPYGAAAPTPPPAPNPEQQRLMQQLREQTRQLQRTTEALLGDGAPGA